MAGDDWRSLSTGELIEILPIADRENDVWTVQTIMKVLAERHPDVKQALWQWSQNPADSRLVWDVILESLPDMSTGFDESLVVRGKHLWDEPLADGKICRVSTEELLISDGQRLSMSEVGALHYDPDSRLVIDAYPRWMTLRCTSPQSREKLAFLIAHISSSPLHDDDMKVLRKKYLK
ncbi:hypothetical protein [Streptomyces aureus]